MAKRALQDSISHIFAAIFLWRPTYRVIFARPNSGAYDSSGLVNIIAQHVGNSNDNSDKSRPDTPPQGIYLPDG